MATLLAMGLLGCHGEPDPGTADPVSFVAGPTVRDNPAAGLTAWLDVSLDDDAALQVEVRGPDRTWTIPSAAASDHTVLLLGLHAATAHDIVVRAVDDQGRVRGEQAATFTPPALPADFFVWDMGPTDLARMEPGVTLVGFGGYLVAIDPQGHPVWYLPIPGAIHEASRLANGNVLVLVNRTSVTEVDLAGTVVGQWRAARTTDTPVTATAVDVDALHHDVIELPDGHLVSLSIERQWIEGYPSSETNPGASEPAWVAGDVVVEFTRTGEVVSSWSLLDRLDPLRIAYDAVIGNYWEDFGPWNGDDIKDWSHGNAVSYDPGTGTILAGMRHQDGVVGLARDTGDLRWILAPRANWDPDLLPLVLEPEDPAAVVPYHMHGAKFTPSGTVMLFDNGNNRASAYEPPLDPMQNFSRAVELALDPDAGTWREVWSYGRDMDPAYYSGSLGDADPLPVTDNVLITFGNVANPELGGVRLLEVTRAGEPVWDLIVPRATATTFRSQRVGGMIPGL